MLPEAKDALHLVESSQSRLLASALSASLGLAAESAGRVRDAVLLAVALDMGDATIPRLAFSRVTRPLS
jgi:hypothetical protein